MRDPLRVYVIYEPIFHGGTAIRNTIARSFDSIGMHREGLRFGVPVHSRSAPWSVAAPGEGAGLPRPIDLDAADSNLILLLHDPAMAFLQAKWVAYVNELKQRMKPADLLVPVLIGGVTPLFAGEVQSMRIATDADISDDRKECQFLIRLLNTLLVRLEGPASGQAQQGHTVFVSHAKRDGKDIAVRIVDLLQKVNQSLGPRCFFDADSLLPGNDYHARFEEAIQNGSLLAVVTSAYHTRPWCRWEILTAKKYGRPVVAADLTDGRIERTFPYLGNVPSIRITADPSSTAPIPDADVERLTLALLSESLRIIVWSRIAAQCKAPNDHLCIRPPELSDLGLIAAQDSSPGRVLYPDPPLSLEETDLLQRAFPQLTVRSLSQVVA